MSPALLVVAALAATPQAELIDFSATWCEPCQQMKPIIEKLHREGYPVREVDVDEQRALANKYKVTALPTFILVVNDKEVARIVGARPESEIRDMFKLVPKANEQAAAPPEDTEPKKRRWLPEFLAGDDQEEVTPPAFAGDSIARGQSPDRPSAQAGVAPMAAQDPMRTAARIRVQDAQGIDYGSGTVIGSKDGQALILTCWHIFRGSSPEDSVQIDLFPNGPDGKPQTFPGTLIKYNEEADVALVGISGCDMMPVSPIAAAGQFPKPGDTVFSYGCGEGKPEPTRLQHRVTRLNPFTGPDTTECTGEPVVGRSGGGLFNADGRVIGVCFAAEKEKSCGVYVGPTEIHALLEEAGFAALIPASQETILAETAGSAQDIARTEAEPLAEAEAENVFASAEATEQLGAATTDIPNDSSPVSVDNTQDRPAITPMDSGRAASVLAGLSGGELEATVVLRRKDRPDLPSQVIVINRVSDRFRRYLTGDVGQQTMETSLRKRAADPHDVARLAAIFNNRD